MIYVHMYVQPHNQVRNTMNTIKSLKHLKKYDTEVCRSKASAEAAAIRIEKQCDFLICAVDYTLYCDGTRDWTVHMFERAA